MVTVILLTVNVFAIHALAVTTAKSKISVAATTAQVMVFANLILAFVSVKTAFQDQIAQ